MTMNFSDKPIDDILLDWKVDSIIRCMYKGLDDYSYCSSGIDAQLHRVFMAVSELTVQNVQDSDSARLKKKMIAVGLELITLKIYLTRIGSTVDSHAIAVRMIKNKEVLPSNNYEIIYHMHAVIGDMAIDIKNLGILNFEKTKMVCKIINDCIARVVCLYTNIKEA